jgi:hypothetical protein
LWAEALVHLLAVDKTGRTFRIVEKINRSARPVYSTA